MEICDSKTGVQCLVRKCPEAKTICLIDEYNPLVECKKRRGGDKLE